MSDQRQAEQSLVGQDSLGQLGVAHGQVAHARVTVDTTLAVDQSGRAEPLDEPTQLTGRHGLAPQVDEVDGDPAILEEAQRGTGRPIVLQAEDLDLRRAWRR